MKRMFIGVKDGSAGEIKKRVQKLDNVTGVSVSDIGVNIEYDGSYAHIAQQVSSWQEVDSVQLGAEKPLSVSTQYEPLDSYLWHYRKAGLDKKSAESLVTRGVVAHNPVKIAVIDSGYRPSHPDAPSSVVAQSLVSGETAEDTGTDHSHGTHVLHSMGSPLNTSGVSGILSNFGVNAEFYIYKMFPSESGSQGSWLSALLDCISKGVDVVNMSFGYESYKEISQGGSLAPTSTVSANSINSNVILNSEVIAYKNVFDNAKTNGVIPVIASGNSYVVGSISGSNPRGPGGVDASGYFVPPQDTVATPAILSQICPGVVSVGSANYNGNKAFFSQKGKGLRIAAYSGDSLTNPENTGFPNISLAGSTTNSINSYVFMQGTSMATPIMAAIIGVILATGVAGTNVSVSSSDVDKILTKLYRGVSPNVLPDSTSNLGHGIFHSDWLL